MPDFSKCDNVSVNELIDHSSLINKVRSNMRRCTVIYKAYVRVNPDPSIGVKPKYDTVEVKRVEAWFHKFVQESDNECIYTMAIVEHDDGTCETVSINSIIFIHPGGG